MHSVERIFRKINHEHDRVIRIHDPIICISLERLSVPPCSSASHCWLHACPNSYAPRNCYDYDCCCCCCCCCFYHQRHHHYYYHYCIRFLFNRPTFQETSPGCSGSPKVFQRRTFGVAVLFFAGWMSFLSPKQQCKNTEGMNQETEH